MGITETELSEFWGSKECTPYLDENGDDLGFTPKEWDILKIWMHEFSEFKQGIKLKEIEKFSLKLGLNPLEDFSKGYNEALRCLNVRFFSTPEQKQAKEMIELASPELIKELKKQLNENNS